MSVYLLGVATLSVFVTTANLTDDQPAVHKIPVVCDRRPVGDLGPQHSLCDGTSLYPCGRLIEDSLPSEPADLEWYVECQTATIDDPTLKGNLLDVGIPGTAVYDPQSMTIRVSELPGLEPSYRWLTAAIDCNGVKAQLIWSPSSVHLHLPDQSTTIPVTGLDELISPQYACFDIQSMPCGKRILASGRRIDAQSSADVLGVIQISVGNDARRVDGTVRFYPAPTRASVAKAWLDDSKLLFLKNPLEARVVTWVESHPELEPSFQQTAQYVYQIAAPAKLVGVLSGCAFAVADQSLFSVLPSGEIVHILDLGKSDLQSVPDLLDASDDGEVWGCALPEHGSLLLSLPNGQLIILDPFSGCEKVVLENCDECRPLLSSMQIDDGLIILSLDISGTASYWRLCVD